MRNDDGIDGFKFARVLSIRKGVKECEKVPCGVMTPTIAFIGLARSTIDEHELEVKQ